MSKKISKPRIIRPFGAKLSGANEFFPEMDTTDQRAPILDPGQFLEQFKVQELANELDNEKLSDFDDDVYEYEDISEYGEDVALLKQPEYAAELKRQAKRSGAGR